MSCHNEGSEANRKHVKEHGNRVSWYKAAGPAATLAYLRESRLVDVDAPEKSLLLRKPLNEVKHGGGIKFVKGDQGYRAFRTFLEDYARIVKEEYRDAKSLPPKDTGPRRFGTEMWVKLTNTPAAWGDRLLQVNVHAWDEAKKAWEAEPVATSDRVVWGKGGLWQHTLTLLAPAGSDRARRWEAGKPSLPGGRYLIKVSVDLGDKVKKDWKADLDPVGQVVVVSAWPDGYGRMTTADAGRVEK
jgi:hypothetical protein